MTIIEHAEKYLGQIDQGWKDNNSDEGLQIVSFVDCPWKNFTTYLSLGLSDYILDLSKPKTVRQELVFSVYSNAISTLVVSFLLSLCEAILNNGSAVLRGEVIPLSGDIAKRIGFEAVYCSIPVFFDDEFSSCMKSTPSTVIVLMLPIYQNESDFIKSNGWESFENLLEQKNPDLFDLDREPII